VLDVMAGSERDVERIELHDLAGRHGLRGFGRRPAKRRLPDHLRGLGGLASGGNWRDRAALDQGGEEVPDSGLGDRKALLGELHDDLGLAPHGLLEAPLLDRPHEGGGPGGLARGPRPPRRSDADRQAILVAIAAELVVMLPAILGKAFKGSCERLNRAGGWRAHHRCKVDGRPPVPERLLARRAHHVQMLAITGLGEWDWHTPEVPLP
jgi:hypothetical protein